MLRFTGKKNSSSMKDLEKEFLLLTMHGVLFERWCIFSLGSLAFVEECVELLVPNFHLRFFGDWPSVSLCCTRAPRGWVQQLHISPSPWIAGLSSPHLVQKHSTWPKSHLNLNQGPPLDQTIYEPFHSFDRMQTVMQQRQ
mmetsp:Transcript_15268/g.20108  ORF Transcript_15268/g.20108 Transcript_15268/m.20108 type:complete len:140 (+) Transcript_15268:514-933(+)